MAEPINLAAQEEVVSVLWDFAYAQQARIHNSNRIDAGKEVSVNLESVGEALKRIMSAFGYSVVRID